MTDDYHLAPQYKAAAASIYEVVQIGELELDLSAQVCIALSNLAIAEAVHMLAGAIRERPVVVNSTGTIDLDPEKVAAAIQASVAKLRREPDDPDPTE